MAPHHKADNIYIYIYMSQGPGFPGEGGPPPMVPPHPPPPRSMDIQPLCEHSIVFDVFCLLFLFFNASHLRNIKTHR